MSYEQLIALLNKCLSDVSKMQADYIAQVAATPGIDLATVKFEAGRLRGTVDFAAYIAQEAKKVEDFS